MFGFTLKAGRSSIYTPKLRKPAEASELALPFRRSLGAGSGRHGALGPIAHQRESFLGESRCCVLVAHFGQFEVWPSMCRGCLRREFGTLKVKGSDQEHSVALEVDNEQLSIVSREAVLPTLKRKFSTGSSVHALIGLLLRISLERNAEHPLQAYSSVVPSRSRSTGTLSIVAQAGPLPVRGIHSILTDVPHCVTSKFPRTLP